MDALPRDLNPSNGEQFTALVCPDCSGAVVVRLESPTNRLVFRCRVGHAYSAEDVLVGKEQHVEKTAWATVHAYEELAAFLRDTDNRIPGLSRTERERRISRLEENAAVLRKLIENDRAVGLNGAAAQVDDGEQ